MKCPNCGAQMPKEALYCEVCGEDIHIVPDFDLSVEEDMEQTLQEIYEETKNMQNSETAVKSSKKSIIRYLSLGLVVLLIIGISAIFILYNRYYSVAYQKSKAALYASKSQYEKSIAYYQRAIELDSKDLSTKFALAEVYFLNNDKTEYEHILRDIVGDQNAREEELSNAYGKLIAIYMAQKDYQTIHDLLLSSNNEKIIANYQDYIARNPEFSLKEGDYTNIQPLKIVAMGTGKIYYTINGENPTTDSIPYTAPIVLDKGDYEVKAIFVNDLGIYSDVVSATYHIVMDEIPAPDISAVSGMYHFPIYIEVLGDDEDVYYTTDGSEPTEASNMYHEKIPMPIGSSVFKFAKVVEGRTGDIATREYNLCLNTDYDYVQAQTDVTQYAMDIGKITDMEGNVHDSDIQYQYLFQYVININEENDFYVVDEVQKDAQGNQTKTGTHFAVNIYTGDIYKLQIDVINNYNLVEIKNESQ